MPRARARSGGGEDPERGQGSWLLAVLVGVPISERAARRHLERGWSGGGGALGPLTLFPMGKPRYPGGKRLASASQLLRAEPRPEFRTRKVPFLPRRVSTPNPSRTLHSNLDTHTPLLQHMVVWPTAGSETAHLGAAQTPGQRPAPGRHPRTLGANTRRPRHGAAQTHSLTHSPPRASPPRPQARTNSPCHPTHPTPPHPPHLPHLAGFPSSAARPRPLAAESRIAHRDRGGRRERRKGGREGKRFGLTSRRVRRPASGAQVQGPGHEEPRTLSGPTR